MSDQTDYDDLDTDDTEPEQKANWRRDLERRAKKADENAKAAEEARKELAFYKAGLPMDDPKLQYFVKGYDGEVSAEAIRKAASDAGFIQPSGQDTAVDDEVREHQRISDASAGSRVAGSLSQADVLREAQKAAEAAPSYMRAQVYADTLAAHGLNRMQRPPQQ